MFCPFFKQRIKYYISFESLINVLSVCRFLLGLFGQMYIQNCTHEVICLFKESTAEITWNIYINFVLRNITKIEFSKDGNVLKNNIYEIIHFYYVYIHTLGNVVKCCLHYTQWLRRAITFSDNYWIRQRV